MLDGEETTDSELDEDEWAGEVGLNTELMEIVRGWDPSVEAREMARKKPRQCQRWWNKDTKFK